MCRGNEPAGLLKKVSSTGSRLFHGSLNDFFRFAFHFEGSTVLVVLAAAFFQGLKVFAAAWRLATAGVRGDSVTASGTDVVSGGVHGWVGEGVGLFRKHVVQPGEESAADTCVEEAPDGPNEAATPAGTIAQVPFSDHADQAGNRSPVHIHQSENEDADGPDDAAGEGEGPDIELVHGERIWG